NRWSHHLRLYMRLDRGRIPHRPTGEPDLLDEESRTGFLVKGQTISGTDNREIQRGPTARHRDVSGPHSVAHHDRVGIAAAVLDEIRSRAMPEEVGVVSRAAQKNIVATQTVETILDVRSGEDIAAGCAVDIEPALQQPAVCQAAPVRELEL